MSTTIKRVALVAVAALGLGVLSVAPSQAAVQADTLSLSSATASTTVGTAVTTDVTVSFIQETTSDSMTVSIRNYTRYTIIIPSNPNTGITLGHVTQIESGTVLAPVITLITPDSGRVGDLVVITGSHFTGATRVIFNVFYDSANFNVDSDTQITAEIPVGVTPTALDGVDVITPGGPSMRFYDFTILP